MEKPYIICHMMMSADGRIDCAMTAKLAGDDEYYKTLDLLHAQGFLSGRVTAETEMAAPGKFKSESPHPIGKESVSVKKTAPKCRIVVDTRGTLLWPDDSKSREPLIVITSEKAAREYLSYLDSRHISWIAAGKEEINLPRAMELLSAEFGIKRLAVVGGGTINGSFLREKLLDEVSLLIGPGIDGRKGMTSVFDGLPADSEPVPLQLKEVKAYENGSVWLRYAISK